jgi:hypothetical protein
MKTMKTLLALIALAALISLTAVTIHSYRDISEHRLHPWEVQMAQLYGNDWYTKHCWYGRTNQTLYYELRTAQYLFMVADRSIPTPAPSWIGWRILTNNQVTVAANVN